MKLLDSVVDITKGTLDAQSSDNSAVFVTVTGQFTSPNVGSRMFIQSFILAIQQGVGKVSISIVIMLFNFMLLYYLMVIYKYIFFIDFILFCSQFCVSIVGKTIEIFRSFHFIPSHFIYGIFWSFYLLNACCPDPSSFKN